jgi:UDP-glucose 4-epimerase
VNLNIVVTGGAGFIGSHTVERLLAEGHRVTVIDNLSTGRLENVELFKDNSNFKLYINDINDVEATDGAYVNADWIIHLAALADIVPSIEKPLDYHRANVDGTVAVMEMARKHGVKRVVYAASSSCYGIPDVYPTPEFQPASPRYPYALTKYLGEQIVMHWSQLYKIPAISLRFFNVYGPRSRTSGTYGAVFGVFLAQKIHNKPYTIVGDGSQSRDFTYVTDVVDAVVTAARSNLSGEIFNVGSSGHYSVNRLVELLGGGEIQYIPKRPGEPDITFADVSAIRAKLNWKPKVTIEDGIQKLIENLDYWKKAPVWTPQTIEVATQKWFRYLS